MATLQQRIAALRAEMHAAAAPEREDYREALRLQVEVKKLEAALAQEATTAEGVDSTAETAGGSASSSAEGASTAAAPADDVGAILGKLESGHLLTERELQVLEAVPSEAASSSRTCTSG